jgi:hypothetical protein
METIKQITEDTFDELVTLIPNHIGNMFETYGEEVKFVTEMAKQNRVITIIEGDGESDDDEGEYAPNMYYVSGYHIVNRIGYLISEEPLPFDFEVKIEW